MRTFIFLICVIVNLLIWNASGQNTETNMLNELDECLYMEYATMRMDLYKNGKSLRFYEMDFYRSGDKMRMEFTEPATEKGRRMLNDNASLWMYLPRTSKVMKIPFKQSFMGSDASNSDLMRMSFEKDYEIVRTTPAEGDIIELELKARDLEVAYNKLIMQYDTKRRVPLKQEMYSLSDKLIKTMLYEDIIRVNNRDFPSTIIIKEELQKNTETKLHYSNIQKESLKAPEYFTLGSLKR